jgi:hypothetical protein
MANLVVTIGFFLFCFGYRGQLSSVSLEDNAAGTDAGIAVDEVDFAVDEHQHMLIATVRGASSQASCKTASNAAASSAIRPPSVRPATP